MGLYVAFTENSLRRVPAGPFREELRDTHSWVSGIPPGKIPKGLVLLGATGMLSRQDLEAFYNSYRGKVNEYEVKYANSWKESVKRVFGEKLKTPYFDNGFIDEVVNGLLFRKNRYFSVQEAEKMLPYVRNIKTSASIALGMVEDRDQEDALEALRNSMSSLEQACALSIMLKEYKPVFQFE